MTRYVVDASVAIKWFVPEVHSDAASRLLREGNLLLVPDFLFLEVGNILWKQQARGDLAREDGELILADLEVFPLQIEPFLPQLRSAYNLAAGYQRTIYDSVYIALARQHDCRMVTADRKLFNALQSTPLAAHLLWIADIPEDPPLPDRAPPA